MKHMCIGDLYAEVIPSECNWQIDDDQSSGASVRSLWITMVKRVPTERNQMWKCVLNGDAKVVFVFFVF